MNWDSVEELRRLSLCSHSTYHVQTLCRKALWIHQGRARLYGDSFDVTQEYLTYHEEKNQPVKEKPRVREGSVPRVLRLWIEGPVGDAPAVFRRGSRWYCASACASRRSRFFPASTACRCTCSTRRDCGSSIRWSSRFIVSGETRDCGFVELPHAWIDGDVRLAEKIDGIAR